MWILMFFFRRFCLFFSKKIRCVLIEKNKFVSFFVFVAVFDWQNDLQLLNPQFFSRHLQQIDLQFFPQNFVMEEHAKTRCNRRGSKLFGNLRQTSPCQISNMGMSNTWEFSFGI